MSAITHTPHVDAALPSKTHQPTPGALPPPALTHSQALEALLQSPPNDAHKTKLPDGSQASAADIAALEQGLNTLGARVGKTTVEHTLKNMDPTATTELINDFNTVLSPDKINTMVRSPNARASTETLTKIATHLNEDAINAVLTPLEAEHIERYRQHVEASLFNLKYQLMNAPVEGRFDLVRRFADTKPGAMVDVENRLANVWSQASSLINIATEVKKANESLQYSHPDDWDRRRSEPVSVQQPNVYSFFNTNESTLDAPYEIKDFVHGRDKVDVSGIRKQLNTKLQWVNQLSGLSGEMQLKYSPTQDASVLVISGNQGEPAFVAKIFGKIKETDLVT